MMVATAGLCALLLIIIVVNFVIGTLTDERYNLGREALTAAVGYFPNSPRLQAKLAATEMAALDRNPGRAEAHAVQAIHLAPYDYSNQLLLAAVKEAEGDRAAAEAALREALRLAPNYIEVHWRLANLLLRQGKLAESLPEFRAATASNKRLLPATLDLVWRASAGKLDALEAATSDTASTRLTLAQFLLKQARPQEAALAFGRIDRQAKLTSEESAAFLNTLVAAGHTDLAYPLWVDIVSSNPERPAFWNGGFESDILRRFSQFDWTFQPSDYVRVAIDAGVAHSGGRSLRLGFVGRATTILDNEVSHLVPVRPGARYRLECFVKADGFSSPAGPQIVVASAGAQNWSAASAPLPNGTYDWQPLAVDFVAPPTVAAITLSIKRKPKYSYDDPTQGTLWFDDFTLKEQ